jgi:hypothetical protein
MPRLPYRRGSIIALLLIRQGYAADIPLVNLTLSNANVQTTTYRGVPALKITSSDGAHQALAGISGLTFGDGTIEADVSGAPARGSSADARGFIGIVFRQQKDPSRFEIIYIRPTNARADDQVRRNHTVQYSSEPEWSWERLRQESPGMYESYADMQAGEWTHMRVIVKGRDASLYINRAEQPCLVVHDLKLGTATGGIALWVGSDTEGYFRNLTITK